VSRARSAAALLAVLACVAPAGVAQAGDGGGGGSRDDNVAVATTEQDGARVFDFAWSIRRQRGGVVDQRNVANAAARCTDCRATAIAFQVVLVTGRPDSIAPRNQALAINDQCTRCVVYAGARQFVRIVDEPVRFTGRGRATLMDVRSTLRRLEDAGLTTAELRAAVEEQEGRVRQVLQDEIVPIAGGHDGHVLDRDDRQSDDD
jgi:putative peptide zinc metalloprotease protein